MNNWILEKIQKEERVKNNDYEEIFFSIAKELMSGYRLKIGSKYFNFTEIEFYYSHKERHYDRNVHEHELQQKLSVYFHDKHGRGGVDIGFGDKSCHGGILIRGIKDIAGYTNGPIKVSEKICEVLESDYKSLTGRNLLGKDITITEGDNNIDKNTIYVGPRVGLVEDSDYLVKSYRFINNFITEHKFTEKGLVFLASKDIKSINDIPNFRKETILKDLKNKSIRASKLYEKYQ